MGEDGEETLIRGVGRGVEGLVGSIGWGSRFGGGSGCVSRGGVGGGC